MEELNQDLLLLAELLEKIVSPVPAVDAFQVLAHLARNTSEFSYDPEHGETYDRWLRRHEALFKREATKLEDAAMARFLLRKLDIRCYERFRNVILPKLPRDINLTETIHTLKRIFGPNPSNERLQSDTSKDITSIDQPSPISTSHGVQKCYLSAPQIIQEGGKQPPAKFRKTCNVNHVFVPSNNGVAKQRKLITVSDNAAVSTAASTRRKPAQPGLQPPSIQATNSRPTPSKSRPNSNVNAKKQLKTKRKFKHGDAVFAIVHRSNSWRWEAATVIEQVGKLECNVWLHDRRRLNRSHVNQLLLQDPETRTTRSSTTLFSTVPASTVSAPADVQTNSELSNGVDEGLDDPTTAARKDPVPSPAQQTSCFLSRFKPHWMT